MREELDYRREAKHVALYRAMLDGVDIVRVPRAWPELSTGRLLTLDWLDGTRMLAHKDEPLAVRNALATAMFTAWWFPFSRFGVIHGDPHLGNYTVFARDGAPAGINLLDYGCIRIFPPKFVARRRRSLSRPAARRRRSRSCTPTRPGASASCRANSSTRSTSGRASSTRRCSTTACAPSPTAWRRRNTAAAKPSACIRRSSAKGPVTVPREFVFMDRAAIGLGAVFLHLRAELNFYRLFNEAIEKFSLDRVAKRQAAALKAAGLQPHYCLALCRGR